MPPLVIAKFEDRYRFLSNFYPVTFTFRGLEWPTAEHAYQAMKATNEDEQRYVRNAEGPSEAKSRGRDVDLRDNWNAIKVEVMERVLRAKFSHPEMAERLESTYPALLIEGNDWGDTFWGVCDGEGQNMLGRLLIRIRDEGIAQ